MARYKNNTPQIVEGFLDKMFGAFVKKRGQQIAKDMGRKDPEMGRLDLKNIKTNLSIWKSKLSILINSSTKINNQLYIFQFK